jgi:two-component system CheB/CheR fusion protein
MKKPPAPTKQPSESFPLVAIGASAGGLEAVTQLIRNIPSNTGMAFIYVQHLSPDYESMLTSLLSKSTKMKVQEAKDGILMRPNNFYIIPPNKEMSVTDGHIKLVPRRKDRVSNLPINIFFSSIAEKHKQYVIGIILSGSGSDGTKGLKVIKQEGGLTFAQDGSAKFRGMPESAIAEGAVDFVLSPKEIAAALIRLSKSGYVKNGIVKTAREDEIENKHPDLKIILQLVYQQKGMDFSHYKMNTIKRRIIRRIQMHKLKTLKQYAEMLSKKSEEVDLLCQDLLINVTSFFRDPDAFAYLRTTLFPKLLKSKTSGETMRIWVPACSTGEEVYSIAMILLELQDKRKVKLPVQIFATDLSVSAIRKARLGSYSEADLISVPPRLVQKYFTKSKDGYRVGKMLRESCVFAQHNILYDPAFSNVDFISCCNLLIYLDAAAQKKVISTFHYALKESGYLMLSKSETIGAASNLFSSINKKVKLYLRKKSTGTRNIPPITPRFAATKRPGKSISAAAPHNLAVNATGHLGSAVDTVLLTRYMPTSVVVNHDMEMMEVRGATELYLRMPSGKASLNILKMARPELAFELRNAIHNSIKSSQTVRKTGIEMKVDGGVRIVSIEVAPLKIEGEEPLLLILFTEQQHVEIYHSGDQKKNTSAKDNRIRKLEEELAASRADMLSISHDHEATIEELQSANEEVVSNNEELRTLNEELETSKEEIESTNDELIRVNQKLQAHGEQVKELHRYSETIIATIHNPMVVLDKELRIKSANKPFYAYFKVHEDLEGKKLYTINNNQWKIAGLIKLLEEIIPRKTYLHNYEITHTFKGLGEKIMLVNARLTKGNNEPLIVLVIEDITERANLQKKEQLLLNELIEANKTLEDLNVELTAFNYVSSHDLQEPLRRIKTFAGFILNKEHDALSDTGKDYFRRMQASVDQMQTLIQDLLTYSRTGVKDRKFEKTDIGKVVRDVQQDLEEDIKAKSAHIEIGHTDQVKTIGFQFRQLMLNLIDNALKYSNPKRTPHIIIESTIAEGKALNEDLLPDISYCHITVTDNGIGFDPRYKERIFGVFERLHEKDKYNGTGIGLAICKKIVKNHNGIITATSRPNKGSTFDIYLPV